MNICEIAFSTEWFLTIPGILITCGVILLIIALIMFVIGASKSKKEKKSIPQTLDKPVEGNVTVVNSEVAPIPVVTSEASVEVVAPTVENVVATSEPMGPIVEGVVPTNVIPEVAVDPVIAPVITPEIVVPTVNEPVSVSTDATVKMPVIEPRQESIPVIEPVAVIPTEEIKPIEAMPMPVVEENEDLVLDTPDALNLEKTSVNIYGGASVVPNVPVQEETRPIYGGANPLDATQNLPKIDVHHEPYSGGKEVVVEAPVVEEVLAVPEPIIMPEPEIKPIEEIPATPSVIQIPVDEQL